MLFYVVAKIIRQSSGSGVYSEQQRTTEVQVTPQTFQARLSKDSNRSGWCVIFSHPIRPFDDGRPNRRIRRGLGTSDEAEAQRLVDQLNDILRKPALWTPAAQAEATRFYDDRIVRAFYDELAPAARDSRAIRESAL